MGIDNAFGAAVFKDHRNRIVSIITTRFGQTNPTLTEAEMVCSALTMAGNLNLNKVLIKCDNAQVVSHFNTAPRQNSHYLLDGPRDR